MLKQNVKIVDSKLEKVLLNQHWLLISGKIDDEFSTICFRGSHCSRNWSIDASKFMQDTTYVGFKKGHTGPVSLWRPLFWHLHQVYQVVLNLASNLTGRNIQTRLWNKSLLTPSGKWMVSKCPYLKQATILLCLAGGLKLGPRFDLDSLTDVPCAQMLRFDTGFGHA